MSERKQVGATDRVHNRLGDKGRWGDKLLWAPQALARQEGNEGGAAGRGHRAQPNPSSCF